MEERRKGDRVEFDASAEIQQITKADNEKVVVEIIDVSKTGIGFYCNQELEKGSIYEAHLQIWENEEINTFLEIKRINQSNDGMYECGANFVGMPEKDSARIANYSLFGQTAKNND